MLKSLILGVLLASTTSFYTPLWACDCQKQHVKKACDCAGGSCPGPCGLGDANSSTAKKGEKPKTEPPRTAK